MEVGIFPPRPRSCNSDHCAVSGCKSIGYQNLYLSFHRFPKPTDCFITKNASGNFEKVDKFKAWKDALKLNKITGKTRVCSLHFKKSDYFLPDAKVKRRFLKKNTVPSCNLPGIITDKEANKARLEAQICKELSSKVTEKPLQKSIEKSQKQNISEEYKTENIISKQQNENCKSSEEKISIIKSVMSKKPIGEEVNKAILETQERQNCKELNINEVNEKSLQDTIETSQKQDVSEECKMKNIICTEENDKSSTRKILATKPVMLEKAISEEVNKTKLKTQEKQNCKELNNTVILKPVKKRIEQTQKQDILEECRTKNNIYKQENQNSKSSLEKLFASKSVIRMVIKSKSPKPVVKHAEVQVNTDCFVPSIIKCIKTDSELNTATGIESFELLNTIVEIVKKESNGRYESNTVIMGTKNRIIMTYVKLKQKLSYSFLAILFNCYSPKHCQRVFYDTIKIISKCINASIPWPLRVEVSKALKMFE